MYTLTVENAFISHLFCLGFLLRKVFPSIQCVKIALFQGRIALSRAHVSLIHHSFLCKYKLNSLLNMNTESNFVGRAALLNPPEASSRAGKRLWLHFLHILSCHPSTLPFLSKVFLRPLTSS